MNDCRFICAEILPEVFKGLSFKLSTMRVILADGTPLTKAQFKVLFGGYTFALDRYNIRTTRDAWRAFTGNEAYRPPFV